MGMLLYYRINKVKFYLSLIDALNKVFVDGADERT